MSLLQSLFAMLFALCLVCPAAISQNIRTEQSPDVAPIVTATASSERVRYIAAGEVRQTRLQVFSSDGTQVFDSDFKLGNLIDWRLQDQQGSALGAGTYLYLVTVKDFSERLTQKYGTTIVDQEQVYLEQTDLDGLPRAQAAALEINKRAEVLSAVDRVGAAGITRTITTTLAENPAATLAKTSITQPSSQPIGPGDNIAGTGTQNRIAKWIDNAATLGDSNIFEDATGRIGIGTSTPTTKLDVTSNVAGASGVFFGNSSNDPNAFSEIGLLNDLGSGGRAQFYMRSSTHAGPDGASSFNIYTNNAAPINIGTNNMPRLRIQSNGNIGVGTINPQSRLAVNGVIESTAGGFKFPDGNTQMAVGATLGANTFNGNQSVVGNLNVSGVLSGASGTFTGNINTNTAYYISGSKVFSVAGTNTFAGIGAGQSEPSIHNSFFGYNAGLNSSTNGGNSFFGSEAGKANTSGPGNSFFGSQAGKANTTAEGNSFFGVYSGIVNTTGAYNSFFGGQSGWNNTTGQTNAFFGSAAGAFNTTGSSNAFFGNSSGLSNMSGSNNSFFGPRSGFSNTTAGDNSFFGASAGYSNTTGALNAFFGTAAGFSNKTGANNSFFGTHAGLNNQSGMSNTFIGQYAGLSNTGESNNTFIGVSSNGAANITNSTAVGFRASVTQSNSLVLGSINGMNDATANTNVGIGTTAPKDRLEIRGGNLLLGSAGQGIILKSPDGASCRLLTIDNAGILVNSVIACP